MISAERNLVYEFKLQSCHDLVLSGDMKFFSHLTSEVSKEGKTLEPGFSKHSLTILRIDMKSSFSFKAFQWDFL